MLPAARRETPFLQRCDRFGELLEQMQCEGVRIDDSSRFRFYSKLLRAFAEQGDTADQLPEDDAMRVGIAATEVGELIEALEMLLRPPRVDGWLPRLQVAIGGHAIPVSGPDGRTSPVAARRLSRRRGTRVGVHITDPELARALRGFTLAAARAGAVAMALAGLAVEVTAAGVEAAAVLC